MRRRNLVIVRAGDQSLHPAWLEGEGERSWDIVVNYFGDDPDRYRVDDVVRIDSKGPKWPALHDLIAGRPDLIRGYEHVWLPDDDLLTDKDTVNRFFDLCTEYRLEVAQPSLTWDSYFGHLTTLTNRKYRIRFTNYVEVMAPCFDRATLERVLPLFSSNLSGWGLDFVWSRYATRPEAAIAIVDEVSVRHTRPVGGPNYAALRAGGISPWDELRTFCRSNGIDEDPVITTFSAVRRDGSAVRARGRERAFVLGAIPGFLPALAASPERRRMLRRLAGMVYKAARNIPDRVSEKPMTGKWRLGTTSLRAR